MSKNLSAKDHSHEILINASFNADEDDSNQMVEMAAEQLANLIWDHWLYIQGQKKKKKLNNPES